MPRAKFGDCQCSSEEEDWDVIDVDSPDGDGIQVVTYKCQTCGATDASAIEARSV